MDGLRRCQRQTENQSEVSLTLCSPGSCARPRSHPSREELPQARGGSRPPERPGRGVPGNNMGSWQ